MAQTAQSEPIQQQIAKFDERFDKSQDKEMGRLVSQEKQDSQLINSISHRKTPLPKNNKNAAKRRQLKILSASKLNKSLGEIYSYYNQSYVQQIKQCEGFDLSIENKLKLQAFLLFAKNFNILKAIFSVQRINVMFKKHATFGKYLTFQNFCTLIDTLSHEPETIAHLKIEFIVEELDKETRDQFQKQEFYNYLQLGNSRRYKNKFTDLFGAFNILDKPRNDRIKTINKKLSLPLIKKNQAPEYKKRDISEAKLRYPQKDLKDIEKNQRYARLLKPESQPQKPVNDEVKQIMLSWQILKSKSTNNMGKLSEITTKPYLKIDPEEEDPYLKQLHPPSKELNLYNQDKYESQQEKKSKNERKNKIAQQIEEIQKREGLKNQQIINRIDKQLQIRQNHRYKL